MDTVQWPQEIGLVKPPPSMEMMVAGSAAAATCSVARPPVPPPPPPQMVERRARPQKEQPLQCPRCNSTNTKFCYYNNYSLTQPRYFCKTCRRYWTEGGSLRNVPVGGGSRKNKRSASNASNAATSSSATTSSTITSTTSTTAATSVSNLQLPVFKKHPVDHMGAHLLVPSAPGNPKFLEGAHDLNLAFVHPHLTAGSEFGHDYHSFGSLGGSLTAATSSGASVNTTSCGLSAMELLRGAGISARGMSPFIAMPNPETTGAVYTPSSFDLQGFRPSNNATTLSFPMDSVGLGDGYSGSLHGVQQQDEAMPAVAASGRMLFPFENLRQISSTAASDQMGQQNRDVQTGGAAAGGDPSPGFWNSMIGGGATW